MYKYIQHKQNSNCNVTVNISVAVSNFRTLEPYYAKPSKGLTHGRRFYFCNIWHYFIESDVILPNWILIF